MYEEVKNKVEHFLEPYLAEWGFVLFDFKIQCRGRSIVVDLLVDKELGGITLDECSRVNRKIVGYLEENSLIDDDFMVEVSSPGLDRPLKTTKDFIRVIGRQVRFHLCESLESKLEYAGCVQEVAGDHVLVKTKNKNISIPLDRISKAVQVIEA